jgi:hypothetical protein
MAAATNAVQMVMLADIYQDEYSEAQLRAFTRHAMCAAHLMLQPRRSVSILPGEALFVNVLRQLRQDATSAEEDGHEPSPLIQLLTGVLQTLERSCMLKTEQNNEMINYCGTSVLDRNRNAANAAIESMSDSGRRRCALAGCGAKEAHVSHFKTCAACKAVVYCSREHQVADWPNHKAACKERAEGREPTSGA